MRRQLLFKVYAIRSIANSNDRDNFLSLFSWLLDCRYQIQFYSSVTTINRVDIVRGYKTCPNSSDSKIAVTD